MGVDACAGVLPDMSGDGAPEVILRGQLIERHALERCLFGVGFLDLTRRFRTPGNASGLSAG
jgi:hypothetical protein